MKLIAFLAARRKSIVALLTPWLVVAGNYLGGVTVSHVWYVLVIGEAAALGVHSVPNATVPNAPSS